MQLQIDDGFQFGLGMFETICLKDKKPVLLSWHLERLNDALQVFGISQSVTENDVYSWMGKQYETGEGSIPSLHALKIMVSEKNRVFAFRSNPYTEQKLEKGFRLDYSKVLRNETSPLVYYKSMNYGDNILEKRKTHISGIDEVLFLNTKGEITEGSTTNVFLVKGEKLYTPKKECGLLPGILRRFVLEYAGAEETILMPEDVMEADECFVTNSLMGIMPVVQVGEKEFLKGRITRDLGMLYQEKMKLV